MVAQHVQRDLRFERVQALGALRVGDVGGGPAAGALLEHLVAIEQRTLEARGHATADGGLARAHQPEEDDVALVGGPAYQ